MEDHDRVCPLSVGLAWALKRKGSSARVHTFIGDMAFLTGIAHESIRYTINHDLPINWIIEDNKKSVGTPTQDVWKEDPKNLFFYYGKTITEKKSENVGMIYYEYQLDFPHSGVGKFISF